jgi:hypothetical protein
MDYVGEGELDGWGKVRRKKGLGRTRTSVTISGTEVAQATKHGNDNAHRDTPS